MLNLNIGSIAMKLQNITNVHDKQSIWESFLLDTEVYIQYLKVL